MRRRRRSPIALDLGEHAVKAVQLERRGTGLRVRAAAHAVVPPGPDATRRARLLDAARVALRTAPFRGRAVSVALRSDDVRTRHIRIPADALDRASELLAREMQDSAGAETAACAMPVAELLERGQQVREFLCCMAPAAAVQEVIAVSEALGLVPDLIDLENCAQVRPFLRPGAQDSFLHVDLGTRNTRITVVRSGATVLMRSVPVGCSHLQQALQRRLGLPVDTLLELAGTRRPDLPDLHSEIAAALAEPLDAILRRIVHCVRYCGALFQGRAVTVMRLGGGLAGLPGLCGYVGRRIGISCELADPFAALQLPAPAALPPQAAGSFATALGLAVRGVDE